jgi:hypothetical protein
MTVGSARKRPSRNEILSTIVLRLIRFSIYDLQLVSDLVEQLARAPKLKKAGAR